MAHIPTHIAIIMDGNGRWAKARGLSRNRGHQEGVSTVRKITTQCSNLGVKYLTLYTFSTENWNRPPQEVAALMALILSSLEEQLFMKNNVRLKVIGDAQRIPENIVQTIQGLEQRTSHNTGLTLVIALSYSSRWEIAQTLREVVNKANKQQIKPQDINEDYITQHLATNFMPDPDLLIRTGGEIRLSNFLLWQSAYTELYFTPTYWPDFNEEELMKAITEYQHRERRFGKTSEQLTPPSAQVPDTLQQSPQ